MPVVAYEDHASVQVTPPSVHGVAWADRLSRETPVQPADLLGVTGGDTVVAVVAHPDDETLAMGATLASLSQVGVRVEVVVLSAGEAALDHVGRRIHGLAARRTAELAAACEQLGVRIADIGRWPDGGLHGALAEIEHRLAPFVEDVRPNAILTLWGEDPHPDHQAASAVAVSVGRRHGVAVGCMPLWAMHWTDPSEVVAAVRRVGVAPAAMDSKARAVAAYESQVAPLAPDLQPILPAEVVGFPFECLVVE